MQKVFDGRNMIYKAERREIRTQKQLQVSIHHGRPLRLCEIVAVLFQEQMEKTWDALSKKVTRWDLHHIYI